MSIIKEFTKAKDIVAYLLDKYPSLRDNDKELYLAYLAQFKDLKNVLNSSHDSYGAFKTLFLSKKTISFNTIRRVRAKFQEEGLYKSSVEVKELRDVADDEVRDHYKKD